MNTIKLLRNTALAFVMGTAVLLLGVATASAQDYHEKLEKRDLKRHQKMEREYYGNSRELKRHQKMEREQLKYEQRLERRGYDVGHYRYNNRSDPYYNSPDYRYDPYYNNRTYNGGYNGNYGYYDKHGHWHSYRRP